MKWKEFLDLHVNMDFDTEVAFILWQEQDVIAFIDDEWSMHSIFSEEKTKIAKEVIRRLEESKDCSRGITWDDLYECTREVMGEWEANYIY